MLNKHDEKAPEKTDHALEKAAPAKDEKAAAPLVATPEKPADKKAAKTEAPIATTDVPDIAPAAPEAPVKRVVPSISGAGRC